MTEGLQYISVRICRKEGVVPVIKGSGTLFEDEGVYYVLTAFHCVEAKDADGTLLTYDKDKTDITLHCRKTEIPIIIDDVVDYNKSEDWMLLKVKKPHVVIPYLNQVRFTNDIAIGERYDTYPYPSVANGKPRFTPVMAVNDDDQYHLIDEVSGGRYTADMVMKGGSGAGIVKGANGEIFYFGYLKSTLEGGALNDVLAGNVQGFAHHLSKEATKRITLLEAMQIKNEEKEDIVKSISQKVTAANNEGKDLNVVENLLDKVIPSLIEQYRTETAMELLNDLKEQIPDIESFDYPLSAKYHYTTARCYNAELNGDQARSHFHEAYLRDKATIKHVEHEILYRLHKKDVQGAKELLTELPTDNELRLAYEVVESQNPRTAFVALPEEIQSKPSFRYRIINAACGKEIDLTWIIENYKPEIPDSLTESNTTDWLMLLTYYRIQFQDYLMFVRPKVIRNKSLYQEAFAATTRFFKFAEGTPLLRNLPIVCALHCYWGFLLEDDYNWIEKFNRIDFSKAGDQQDFCAMISAAMLSMTGKPTEGYFALRSHNLKHNNSLFRFVIGLTGTSGNASIIQNYLAEHKDESVEVNIELSDSIAGLSSVLDNRDYKKVLDSCSIVHEGAKRVLYDAIHLNEHKSVSIEGYEDFVDDLFGNTASLAAIIMAFNGKKEFAKDFIKRKLNEHKLPTYWNALLQILQSESKDTPELYRLLKELRKSDNVFGIDQLYLEYNLALRLSDYDNAFEVIENIYHMQPGNEWCVCAYIDVLGRTHPEMIANELDNIQKVEFTEVRFVEAIYRALAQNGYIVEAAEFLLKQVLTLCDEGLSSFYDKECVMGFLAPVVNERYDYVTDGSYVILDIDSKREPRRIKAGTLLNDQLIGRYNGEEFEVVLAGEKKIVKIVAIQNKFAHQHAVHMKEVMESGGNQFFTPIKVDINHPEQLLDKLKELSGGVNHESIRKNAYKEYLEGKRTLLQMISQDDIVGDYYKFLFSQFRIQVQPYQVNTARKKDCLRESTIFQLDFTSLFLLYEFNLLHPEVELPHNLLLPRFILETIKEYRKNVHVLSSFSLYEAMQQGCLYHYSQNGSDDLDMRFDNLLKWIETHCTIEENLNVLAIDASSDNPIAKLFSNVYVSLTDQSKNIVIVSEDTNVEFMVAAFLPVITTESLLYHLMGDAVGEKFSVFLTDNNNAGANVPVSYICDQYRLFEEKQPNKMNVILDVNSIQININNIHEAAISIMKNAKDAELALSTVRTLIGNLVRHAPANVIGTPMWSLMLRQLSEDPIADQYLVPIYKEAMNAR